MRRRNPIEFGESIMCLEGPNKQQQQTIRQLRSQTKDSTSFPTTTSVGRALAHGPLIPLLSLEARGEQRESSIAYRRALRNPPYRSKI